MQQQATVVVPPMALAKIHGVYGVRISARKVDLLDQLGNRVQSAWHRQGDKVAAKSFEELVVFVKSRNPMAAAR